MSVHTPETNSQAIPLPIVKLNRAVLLAGVIGAIALQQPVFVTVLFFIILPAVLFGRRASLIYIIGSRLLAGKTEGTPVESPQLMRFNNAIAAILLGAAQLAFLLDAPLAGWVLSGIVGIAAAVALGGFCFGCFLYYQFNLQRYRLFGK
ncbi:MAG: DUF4395 domain-containing protein [Chlorobi bacterium]|nr:DUF4395 domain-containing protein [Chlorobiota bacterium]